MRILFALSGLHRHERGAEVAFTSLASELVRQGDQVTLIGSGYERPGTGYDFLHAGAVSREAFEQWPQMPVLRGDTAYEEATFAPGLLRRYRPDDYDVTVTCSFPFTNWVLRRPAKGGRPPHVFVTQNGDWPAVSDDAEFRSFECEGLVCTNPDYFERNQHRWNSALIPNGIDLARFGPGAPDRSRFGLPEEPKVVLMVSALIASKRVADGILAASQLPDVHLVCAGDGPLRTEIEDLAQARMPGRFTRLTVPPVEMPDLYRSADVFLHLSRDESFGNVYVEAMACGLPIVAHDIPRVRWIVGDDEHLIDTDQPTQLVSALREVLDASVGTDASRQNRAEAFAWSGVAAKYRAFFSDVIARQG